MTVYNLSIPYRLRDAVAEAEQHVRDVKRYAGVCPLPWDETEYHEWWIETFGTSHQEFEEMAEALVRSYKRTKWWRLKERRRLMGDYIRVKAILTAGRGLETVWR